MKKFDFRLQRVLDYRRMVEEWAKEAYLDARAKRLEGEVVALGLQQQRQTLLINPPLTIEECQALDLRLALIDDQEMQQNAIVEVLKMDEEKTLLEYREKKAEAEILQKLRDKAHALWMTEMNRIEQAELDEWSVQRRAA
jgi:flagellar protein FliJ